MKNVAEVLSISTRPNGENVALINSFMFLQLFLERKIRLAITKQSVNNISQVILCCNITLNLFTQGTQTFQLSFPSTKDHEARSFS